MCTTISHVCVHVYSLNGQICAPFVPFKPPEMVFDYWEFMCTVAPLETNVCIRYALRVTS